MENNLAFVATLKNITPIPGADKIVKADVVLNDAIITSVVSGVDTKENTPVVYFDSNLCLSETLLKDYTDLGKYLGKNGRVKVVKLKGTISNGLVVPIEQFFKYEKKALFVEGFSFDKLGGKEMCHKYIVPIKIQNIPGKKGRKGKRLSRMLPNMFAFHVDTDQLARNIHNIKPDDVISISNKIHGTSAIVSNNCVRKSLSPIHKLLKYFFPIVDVEYDYIYASRTVVKNGSVNSGYYGEDIWGIAGKKHFGDKLHKGETIYYEIVGFLPSGGSIQKCYDYGCAPCEHKIAVYRITYTNPDGVVFEMGWQAMKERCQELGVPMVEELYYGKAKDLDPHIDVETHWHQNFLEALKRKYLEKKCLLCKNDVPAEGVVLRKERNGIEVYKLKSEAFFLRESQDAEAGVENVEDEQGVEV